MNGEQTDRRWQLQETEDRGKQWNLLDSEQDLDGRWQLQPDNEYANYDGYNWQPIEDLPEERGGGTSWVLPSLVLVAVLAVAGYVAMTGLDRIGLSGIDLGSLFATTPSEIAANQPAGEPQVTNEAQPTSDGQAVPPETQPTATDIAPTSTATTEAPTATPQPTLEKRTATVREQYGVNARSAPNTVGDPVQVIAQGIQLPIWDAQTNDEGDWYQVSLPDKSLAWVAASFVDVATSAVTYDEMNQSRLEFGLPLVPTPTAEVPVAVEATAVPLAETTPQADPNNSELSLAVTAAISSPLGLNLRAEGNSTSEAITLLADSLTFPVVGQSEDAQWLQLQLPDGTLGWAAAQFLRVSGDVTQLPVGGISETLSVNAPISSTAELTSTNPLVGSETVTTSESITGTSPSTAAGGITNTESITNSAGLTATDSVSLDNATATVTFLGGSRVRQEPKDDSSDLVVLDFGTEMKATGRTEDGTFIQVELADGTQGWVTPNTVELNVNAESLPIVK